MKKYYSIIIVFFLVFITFFNTSVTEVYSQLYDWENLQELDDPPGIPTMAAANGKIYVMSGTNGGQAPTHEYDPATDTWSTKTNIPQSCFWATAASLNGKIYVMGGGQPYPGTQYNFIYDPATDSWTRGADLPTPRMYHSSAVANGKIYLIGGQNGDGTSEWNFEEYDPVTDTWAQKARLLNNGAWYCGAVGIGNKVYRIAGGGSGEALMRDHFQVYDTDTDEWTVLRNFRIKLHAPFAVQWNNEIVLIGGYSNKKYIDSLWFYNPALGLWSPPMDFNMPQPRSYHRAVELNDCIYVFGGQNSEIDLGGSLIRFCAHTSVNDFHESIEQVKVYPNPSNGNFSVSSEFLKTPGTDIKVFDIFGRNISIKSIEHDQNGLNWNINLQDANPGLYIIRIKYRHKSITGKIIIK